MNILNALIRSSSNPENISLFIKSLATFALLSGFDSVVVSESSSYAANFITGLGMLASSITGLYGLYRKARFGRWSAHHSDSFVED